MLSQVKGGTCWKTKFWFLETGFIRVLLPKAATDFGEQRQGIWLLIKLNPNLGQWQEGGHAKFPHCGAYRSASPPLFPNRAQGGPAILGSQIPTLHCGQEAGVSQTWVWIPTPPLNLAPVQPLSLGGCMLGWLMKGVCSIAGIWWTNR